MVRKTANLEFGAVQKYENLADLKSAAESKFKCKNRLRYSQERTSQSLPIISQNLEKNI